MESPDVSFKNPAPFYTNPNLLLRVCFLPQFLVTVGDLGKKKSHKDFISNALFWCSATHARNRRVWGKQCLIRSQETQILLPAPLICFAILGTHFPSQVLSFPVCTMERSSSRPYDLKFKKKMICKEHKMSWSMWKLDKNFQTWGRMKGE